MSIYMGNIKYRFYYSFIIFLTIGFTSYLVLLIVFFFFFTENPKIFFQHRGIWGDCLTI